MSSPAQGEQQRIPLIEGFKLRCPNCQELRHLNWYTAYDIPEAFKADLNAVYQCPHYKGGCGHVFSPGDPQIISDYLAGKLVPVEAIPDLIYAGLGFDPRGKRNNGDREEGANGRR